MADILSTIGPYKRAEIEAARRRQPLPELEREARDAPPPRAFLAAIERRTEQGEYALICEIKKTSPSKGLIRPDFDPPAYARDYEAGGAACLSVLTDGPSFQGDPAHLTQAREATSLPVLRKDFMYDPYQVFQARAWGADCILIILAAVDDATAAELEDAARSFGMDVLVEVHDEEELKRACRLRTRLIGINNRSLTTFKTTLATSESLAPLVPSGHVTVGESGITGPADLVRLAASGIRAFLIGESLMRAPDIAKATRGLLADAS